MKNNELRVEYSPEDVIYAGGKSLVYPGVFHSWRCGRYKKETTLIPSIEDTTIGEETTNMEEIKVKIKVTVLTLISLIEILIMFNNPSGVFGY